ncbi:MAG TPA: VOC family protein [Pseudolabrys sp.]|nr:VOC family protein [Pseudolabrys sp.]
MLVQPYLFFNGRCEEAIEFYKSVLGAKVEMLMRFSESPEKPQSPDCVPSDPNKIMHASIRIGDSMLMGSDGMTGEKPEFKGFSLSLTANGEAEAEKTFNALAQGGQVFQPLVKTFFSPRFGMVQDKFGVGWMVMALPAGQ